MMAFPPRFFIPILTSTVLVFYVTSIKCDETSISPEVFPHIRYVPCIDRDGNCTLQSFMMKYTNSSEFIKSWILALYFDHTRYSSSDIVSEVLPTLNKKLLTHQIIFGRVPCNDWSNVDKSLQPLCDKMDPSTIYAYLKGKKTEYWWSVSDLLSHRSFVLGNLLTLQYKGQLELFTASNHEEEMIRFWKEEEPKRKFLLAVHVASSNLEVNTTATVAISEKADSLTKYRVKTFDLLGHVLQNIPHVKIIVITGVISEGVEFRYYDNQRCPKIHDDGCQTFNIVLEDMEGRDIDDMLCDLERYSNGAQEFSYGLKLAPNGTAGELESAERLIKMCALVLMVDDERIKDDSKFQKVYKELEYQIYDVNMPVIRASRAHANQLLKHIGAPQSLMELRILFKFHTDHRNNDTTAVVANSTSPSGHNIILKPYTGKLDSHSLMSSLRNDMKQHFVSQMHGEDEDPEFNPYVEGDELFLLWSNQKPLNSPYFTKLNETGFNQLTSRSDSRAVILFYQPWSTGSVYSRDLVFPAAANHLQAAWGVTDRLYAVNCFDYNEVCEKETIQSYPSVKIYKGAISLFMPGTISLKKLVKFGFLLEKNYFVTKSREEMNIILNYTNSIAEQAIIAVDVQDTKTVEKIEKAAGDFLGRELIILAKQEHLPTHLQKRIEKGLIVSYSKKLRPDIFYQSHTSVNLSTFIADAHRSRVTELTLDFFNEIAPMKRPLLILFVHRMTEEIYCLLSGVANDRIGQMFVTWMHARKQHDLIIFKDIQSPELVLRDPNEGVFYRYKINMKTFTTSENCSKIDPALASWLDGIQRGEVKPHESIQTRKYPPSGPHIDMRNAMYPPESGTADSDEVSSEAQEKSPESAESGTSIPNPHGINTPMTEPPKDNSDNINQFIVTKDEAKVVRSDKFPEHVSKVAAKTHNTEEL